MLRSSFRSAYHPAGSLVSLERLSMPFQWSRKQHRKTKDQQPSTKRASWMTAMVSSEDTYLLDRVNRRT